jgi:DHA1 family solute carrier family 18 vesicular amine transporter 1/2
VGLTIGNLVGPPVGGALYQRFGFRAPFIFGIIFAGIDLVARLLLVERHEAIRWGVDPMDISAGDRNMSPEAASEVTASERTEKPPMTGSNSAPHQRNGDSPVGGSEAQIKVEIEEELREGDQTEKESKPRVTVLPHIVLLKLMKSPRATVCIVVSLVWGLVWIAQETTVVLHMNRVWGLDPDQAGIAFIAAVVPTVFCQSWWLSSLVR